MTVLSCNISLFVAEKKWYCFPDMLEVPAVGLSSKLCGIMCQPLIYTQLRKHDSVLHFTTMDLSAKSNSNLVTLVVKNGKEFKAHKEVLSEVSPFFEKLLNSDMKESKEGVIRLEIFSDLQMKDTLDFVYAGDVVISTQERAEGLIEVADYLCLSKLKQKAGNFLQKTLSSLNCLGVYYMAKNYVCEELIASTQKFIHSHFCDVADSEEFMNLPCHEVEKWISSDEIVINAEEDVFKITLRWIERNKSYQSVKFRELFRHVRLTFVSRDFLIKDVVTNYLVKQNKECMDCVTSALAWINRATNHVVPRPHTPRKVFQTDVIAVTAGDEPIHISFYIPDKDVLYRLPQRADPEEPPEHIISCRGKLFVVSQDANKSHFFDPDINQWRPAPWTATHSKLEPPTDDQVLTTVLSVENEIWLVFENNEENSSWLWRYDLDSNLAAPSTCWLDKTSACLVVVNNHVYAIGGFSNNENMSSVVPQCARFHTKQQKWQSIASLQKARYDACAVATNDKIYIAGGCDDNKILKTCEMYIIDTDEWLSMASLTTHLFTGSLVMFNGVLHAFCPGKSYEWRVECYDVKRDKWEVKKRVPTSKKGWQHLFACSFALYKGVLDNLQALRVEEMEKPQPAETMLTQYAVM